LTGKVLLLVADLERQGVKLKWGSRGLVFAGAIGRLTPDYREALRPHVSELEALAQWYRLQGEAEAQFGQPCARLYPFFASPAADFWRAPRVRTSMGLAHLVQVLPEFCRVALAQEVQAWRKACRAAGKRIPFPRRTVTLGLDQVWPPVEPPKKEHSYE
jgi:hypothetical protein